MCKQHIYIELWFLFEKSLLDPQRVSTLHSVVHPLVPLSSGASEQYQKDLQDHQNDLQNHQNDFQDRQNHFQDHQNKLQDHLNDLQDHQIVARPQCSVVRVPG